MTYSLMLVKSLLCKIGIHGWEYSTINSNVSFIGTFRRCKICNVKHIFYGDRWKRTKLIK